MTASIIIMIRQTLYGWGDKWRVPQVNECSRDTVAPGSQRTLFCHATPGLGAVWVRGSFTTGRESGAEHTGHPASRGSVW